MNDETVRIAKENRSETDMYGQAADRLRLWLEGEQASSRAIDVFVEAGADPGVLENLPLSTHSWVFVDEAQIDAFADLEMTVVPYSGRLEPLGGELALSSEVLVQTESYATAPYVSISVPTAFSIADEVDLSALHIDAETARHEGRFPEYLTTPIATLVDERTRLVPVLPAPSRAIRLLVRADGTVLDGPFGAPVGADLAPSGEVSPYDGESTAMARFLGAAKVVRALRPRFGAGVAVAGFGSEGAQSGVGRVDSVFVASADEQHYVVDLATRRMDRVPAAVADLVERLFTSVGDREFGMHERAVLTALGLAQYQAEPVSGAVR